MSTLKVGEITCTLEILPGTSTLENEIQRYVQIRDFGLNRHSKSSHIKKARLQLAFSKALGLRNAG